MKVTRKQLASRIRDVRYAVKSGACTVAMNFVKEIGHYDGVRDATWQRLVRMAQKCKVSPNFRRRRKR